MYKRVAIIDVGSNSIKDLVAEHSSSPAKLHVLAQRTLDVRISKGITGSPPRLGEEAMARGLDAVAELVDHARSYSPELICIVATSAVRDAVNGALFAESVRQRTGIELRILSGDDEARLIGHGLLQDPALCAAQSLFVFDLGGGSMECLHFENRTLVSATSLQLGCVRLTERFFSTPDSPPQAEEITALRNHVRATLATSGLAKGLSGGVAVFAGGSMTTTRAILAARTEKNMDQLPPIVSMAELRELCEAMCAADLENRKRAFPGLPPARADVFPAAILTMLEVGDVVGVNGFMHSFYNLRFGLAAELLFGQ